MIPYDAINAAMAWLPEKMDSPAARLMLVAIGLQESGFEARRQHGNGPARGFWQFEKAGGIRGVLRHHATAKHAESLCVLHGVVPTEDAAWAAIETNDELAAGLARLLLWSDRYPLPDIGDEDGAWALYMRTWRPGKPHRDRWSKNYPEAVAALDT